MRACPHCLTVYESDPEFCAFDGTRTVAFAGAEDPLAGLELDGYRLEERLGVGGTGCVYRGRKLDTGRTVAIKLLFGEMATDKGLAERFRREARAMKAIAHPNVVAVYACTTSAAGLTYLAMEYVEGRTLKQIVEEEAPLAPHRVARLAEQLVAGMGQAHRLGYVHRDLKPSNVMVSGPPGSEIAKILDFGIVASLHEREADSRLTKTGYIVGTPTYMAPEQVDPKSVTPQADVYALGVMIYEMLVGKPPFTGTLEQILVAKMTAPPPPLEHAGALGALVSRLLAIDPEDRPPTALHVSAELSRLSLLSADPATEKARVPDLPQLGVVGFGQATVQLVDQTDETPMADEPPLRETAEGPWSVDTRLTPDLGPAEDEALDRDTPEDDFPSFSELVPTRAELRSDTVVDTNPLDAGSVEIDASAFSDVSRPTTAEHDTDDHDRDAAHDQTLEGEPAEGPTRVTSFDPSRGRPASAATGPALGAEDVELSTAGDLVPPDEDDAPNSDDTALLAPVDDVTDEAPPDEDIGFADTRIRPSHTSDGSGPTWAAHAAAPPVAFEPPALIEAEDAAATAFDPAHASADLVDDLRGPAPALVDGPTALASLLPDDEVEDPGDGDTALDLSLDSLDVRADDPTGDVADPFRADARFVDPAPPSAPSPPPSPAPRRWLLGAVAAALLLAAALLTYRVLAGGEVIDIPTTPGPTASP